MTVSELATAMSLEILALPMPDKQVEGAYAGDLLSWVMGRASEGCVWATIMTNMNVVAVASLAGASLTVICEQSAVEDEVVRTAQLKGVNLVRTRLPMYEFCVALSSLLK